MAVRKYLMKASSGFFKGPPSDEEFEEGSEEFPLGSYFVEHWNFGPPSVMPLQHSEGWNVPDVPELSLEHYEEWSA